MSQNKCSFSFIKHNSHAKIQNVCFNPLRTSLLKQWKALRLYFTEIENISLKLHLDILE